MGRFGIGRVWRGSGALLVLLALAVRLAAPQGWMLAPGDGHGAPRLVICTGHRDRTPARNPASGSSRQARRPRQEQRPPVRVRRQPRRAGAGDCSPSASRRPRWRWIDPGPLAAQRPAARPRPRRAAAALPGPAQTRLTKTLATPARRAPGSQDSDAGSRVRPSGDDLMQRYLPFRHPLAALSLAVARAAALACACGCGVFDVGDGTFMPNDADSGSPSGSATAYMDQNQNWEGDHKAPASDNAGQADQHQLLLLRRPVHDQPRLDGHGGAADLSTAP